jgi:lipopolysaccharide transport system ATP-binding protein
MADSVIKAEGLGKNYLIGHQSGERYTALRDVVSRGVKGLAKNAKGLLKGNQILSGDEIEEFWALKDLNFEVKQGERLGIIGRNGAGKSTLLKVLSRITEPSAGQVSITGRVSSLLEVGTGFHPELTGRENIYLNGAILGMKRQEVRQKFDEIVEFAEVEKFLDTPVKRFSSGMYVRLAFAVAAHLEPDILVVDEVLAVGDAKFQKKCIGKMEDVSQKEGRTILLVSHNMSTIKSMCNSALILHQGQKIFQGDVMECVNHYMKFSSEEEKSSQYYKKDSVSGKVGVSEAWLTDNEEFAYPKFKFKLRIVSTIETSLAINLRFKDGLGFPIGYASTHDGVQDLLRIKEGENTVEFELEESNLAAGEYKVSLELVYPGYEYFEKIEDAFTISLTGDKSLNRSYKLLQKWGYGATYIPVETQKVTA